MAKRTYAFIFILCSYFASGQIKQQQLYGTWQLDTASQSFHLINPTRLSFYPNHMVQMSRLSQKNDSLTPYLYRTGTWKIKKKHLLNIQYKNEFNLNTQNIESFPFYDYYDIHSLDSNQLVLYIDTTAETEDGRRGFFYYEKTNPVPLFAYPEIINPEELHEDSMMLRKLVLHRADKPGRIYKMRPSLYVDVNAETHPLSFKGNRRCTFHVLFFESVVADTLLKLKSISSRCSLYDSAGNFTTRSEGEAFQYVPLSNIRSISYASSQRNSFHNTTVLLSLASFLTATVVAPLISIGYVKGGFNAERYKKTALYGGAAFSLSLTFTLCSRPRMFYMHTNGKKNRWVINGVE